MNALWMTESLVELLDLRPGMRVLDLGCGRAISSIFLAEQFGVTVWAVDMLVSPTANFRRALERDCTLVLPLRGEAHALPFAREFFDVLLSVSAYHFWGTEDDYLDYWARFVKLGGQLGFVSPALARDLESADEASDPVRRLWPDTVGGGNEFSISGQFRSATWWRAHWERSGSVRVRHAELLEAGWWLWMRAEELACDLLESSGGDVIEGRKEAEMLRGDGGRTLGIVRVVAEK